MKVDCHRSLEAYLKEYAASPEAVVALARAKERLERIGHAAAVRAVSQRVEVVGK